MRLIYALPLGLLGLPLGIYGLISCSQTLSAVSVQPTATPRFQGTILIASDADQIATAYADGVLNKVAGVEDSLTVLTTDSAGTLHRGQVRVSNSVISWPWILTHSPDGRYAYVAETRDAYTGSAARVNDVWRDMPPGAAMTVVDISQPTRPTIVQQRTLGRNLSNASVNQIGDLLATGSTESGREVVISTLRAGLIDSVYTFPIAGIDPKRGTNAGVKGVEFHPTLNVVAVNLNNQDVLFYEIQRAGPSLTIRPVGAPMRVATC